MRKTVVLAAVLLFAGFVLPAHAEDSTAVSILKSAGAKGGEVAAKYLAGLLYDTSCKDMNTDKVTGYACIVLSGASGRGEQEWKDNVTKKLEDIHAEVKVISRNQEEVGNKLATLNTDINLKFKNIAQTNVAVAHLVGVEGLWGKFAAQFDENETDVTPAEMVSFAKEIMAKKPQTALDELNAVLTQPIPATGGEPLIKYPFSEWRVAHSRGMEWEHDMMDAYDYGEKRFVDFRLREEKAYAMYLWAASVLATDCKLHPAQCVELPRPIDGKTGIREDWKRYTQQQAAAFNSAVDWLLLSYGPTRSTKRGDVLPQKGAVEALLRANYLTSTILGEGRGLWGRVISMGNAWDGSLQVSCGANAQTLMPVLKYTAPAGGSGINNVSADSGPIDWWVSSRGNNVFDEVRFSNQWQMYIYSIPTATAGQCTVSPTLPKGGILPWVYPGGKVVEVTIPKEPGDVTAAPKKFPFGSFVAVQRAGGNYALVSGKWGGMTQPERLDRTDDKGTRKKVEQASLIDFSHSSGPWIGIFEKGRAEYQISKGSSRIHNRDRIYVETEKKIRFPEDTSVKLHFYPGECAGDICAHGKSIMQYDIENNDTESKKGWLRARAALFFPGAPENADGVVVNGSYDKTGDRKTANIDGLQVGRVSVEPGRAYPFAYEISIDMETEGRFTNASEYMYRVLIAPGSVFLTK